MNTSTLVVESTSDAVLIGELKRRGYCVVKSEHVGAVWAQEIAPSVDFRFSRTPTREHIYERLGSLIGFELMRCGFLPVMEIPNKHKGETEFRATCTALFAVPEFKPPYPTQKLG